MAGICGDMQKPVLILMQAFKKYRKELMRKGINIYEALVKQLQLPPTSETLNKVID